MKHEVAVLRDTDATQLPSDAQFRTWVRKAVQGEPTPCSVVIRIVGAGESRRLNRRYRGRRAATNVLSFPAEIPPQWAREMGVRPLGDVVICAALVEAEAGDQGKPVHHHWAHLTVHGVLHLLGHDHVEPASARRMEHLEREILEGFGIPDPYREG